MIVGAWRPWDQEEKESPGGHRIPVQVIQPVGNGGKGGQATQASPGPLCLAAGPPWQHRLRPHWVGRPAAAQGSMDTWTP